MDVEVAVEIYAVGVPSDILFTAVWVDHRNDVDGGGVEDGGDGGVVLVVGKQKFDEVETGFSGFPFAAVYATVNEAAVFGVGIVVVGESEAPYFSVFDAFSD